MTRLYLSRRSLLGSLGAGLLMTANRTAIAAPVTLEGLKKAREVKVGCEAAYVPFTYRDNTGNIIGFDVDFATRIWEPAGVKPIFIDTQWSGVIPALYAGRFDMVPTMSYTKERLERVLFSIPYADASQALLIRAADKDKVKTIADLSGKVLGIKLGSPGETLKLKLEGDKVTGTSDSSQGSAALTKGVWSGNKLSFSLDTPNGSIAFTGMMKDGKLAGEFDFAGQTTGKWEAKKK